jgi:hypothetical protein
MTDLKSSQVTRDRHRDQAQTGQYLPHKSGPSSSPSSGVPGPTKLLFALIGGLAVTLFWLWVTAAGSAAPQNPHHVPVAVVGPQPAVTQLAKGLQRGNAFQVVATPTEAEAINLVQHRQADAVVNLDTHQLQTAPAASTLTAMALEQELSSPASALHLQTTVIKPLAPGDPTGLGLMFISLACVLGGLPSGVVLAFLSRSRRPASLVDASGRVVLTFAFSGLMALFIALVADGVLGYGGSHMLAIWAWGTLLCAASMAAVAALVAALGIAGVLVAALPFLFFGVASAPEPSPWNWQSVVFRVLGPFDPFGATTAGIRNSIFFGPASQARNLAVLAVWIAVPVVLLFALGWGSQQARRRTSNAVVDVAAMEGLVNPGATIS